MSAGCEPVSHDEIEVKIENVSIRVIRRTTLAWPHEVTVVIPRAEIRRRRYVNGKLDTEEEIILNSITVVHAPRHPLADEKPPGAAPAPPRIIFGTQ